MIVPASPPLPTTCNLPFHPLSGNQTSNWIADVGVGLSTPFTAQKAGSLSSARERAPGGVNAPVVLGRASVIVVSVSLRPVSASQFGAAIAGVDRISAAALTATVTGSKRFIMWLLRKCRLLYPSGRARGSGRGLGARGSQLGARGSGLGNDEARSLI